MNSVNELIRVENLSVNFPVKGPLFSQKKYVHAVSDVTLSIKKGETFGLVGESGCGKTTLAHTILGMIKPTAGSVYFNDKNINEISKKEFLEVRKEMQMVFQDPFSSLNPRFDVFNIFAEPMIIRGNYSKEEINKRVLKLLDYVGLSKNDLYRYPSDFSGGQRQRLGIARAIALNPAFIVCDEPVSALDVSIHSQILNLLKDLQEEFNLTYLFISHNLAVVKHMCDTMVVMYLGKVVEIGSSDVIFNNPLHPYTKALLSAVMDIDIDNKNDRIMLKGEIPSPIDPPEGCRFSTRCREAKKDCGVNKTCLIEVEKDHFVACHQYE